MEPCRKITRIALLQPIGSVEALPQSIYLGIGMIPPQKTGKLQALADLLPGRVSRFASHNPFNACCILEKWLHDAHHPSIGLGFHRNQMPAEVEGLQGNEGAFIQHQALIRISLDLLNQLVSNLIPGIRSGLERSHGKSQ